MYKLESPLKNETHKWDFEIQIDHLIRIQETRPRVNCREKKLQSSGLHREKKRKWKDELMLETCQRTKKKNCGIWGWMWCQL